MENLIEIGTVPGIAAIVWLCIELFAKPVSSRWKPPLAGILGLGWAGLAYVGVGAFGDPLTAAAAGLVAAGTASGIDAYRRTYTAPPPPEPPTPLFP